MLNELLAAKPFVPFELSIGNERFVIDNPKRLRFIDEGWTSIAIFDPVSERTTYINLNLVYNIRTQGREDKKF